MGEQLASQLFGIVRVLCALVENESHRGTDFRRSLHTLYKVNPPFEMTDFSGSCFHSGLCTLTPWMNLLAGKL
jgi:hypothetical protein